MEGCAFFFMFGEERLDLGCVIFVKGGLSFEESGLG
jgi:hypothetical protein